MCSIKFQSFYLSFCCYRCWKKDKLNGNQMPQMNQNKADKLHSGNKAEQTDGQSESVIGAHFIWSNDMNHTIQLKKKDVHSDTGWLLSFKNVNKSSKHIDNFSIRDLISFNYFEHTTSEYDISLLMLLLLFFLLRAVISIPFERDSFIWDNELRFTTMWQ